MIALIPAKGTSTRIPNKNKTLIANKPLLGWTIEALRKSSLISEIYITSESLEIEQIATDFGAIPHRRPTSLCDPETPLRPVIQEFLLNQPQLENEQTILVVLPTAALVTDQSIKKADRAIEACREKYACAFSCVSYGHPIERSFVIQEQRAIRRFSEVNMLAQTQEFEPSFHDAGTFYLGTRDYFLSRHTIFDGYGIPIVVPAYEGLDVDWPEDLVILEALINLLK